MRSLKEWVKKREKFLQDFSNSSDQVNLVDGLDWRELLQNPYIQNDVLADLSSSWSFCYIGEKRWKNFGMCCGGAPRDGQLDNLGREFMSALRDGNRKRALKIADQIDEALQKRGASAGLKPDWAD